MKASILKIGDNIIDDLFDILLEREIAGHFLYISDETVNRLYGDIIKEQISRLGQYEEEIVSDNTISYALSVAEQIIANDIEYIVAIGGGKVLDISKYAAYISKKILISIPTTAANDGIASPIAVLKTKEDKPKSIGAAPPFILVVDTDIIAKGPVQLIKAGIGDTISNYMALQDWDFAVSKHKDTMNGYAYMMSRTSLDALMKTEYDSICKEFIEVLVNSLVLSGIAMDFAGSSRPVSGSEHLFSHALDYYSENKNLHGIQVALGTVSVLKLLNRPYNDVLNYLRKFQVDINPKHLGIDDKTFILCMKKATSMRKDRYTYLHAMNLDDIGLLNLYNELVEEL